MKYLYYLFAIIICFLMANNIKAQQARIEGYIFTDKNNNCAFDSFPDVPQVGIIVSASNNNGTVFYANTNANGFYNISNLPAGTYTVAAHFPYNALYYNLTCSASSVVTVLQAQQIDTISFALAPLTNASLLRTDISAHHLIPCDTAKILISCDNIGTNMAFTTNMEVQLDPYISFLSGQYIGFGSANITPSNNNTVLITIDSLPEYNIIFPRHLIVLDALVSCAADIGQTHLNKIRLLSNDTLTILPNFGSARLHVEKDSCSNNTDDVKFRIINPTTPTTQPYIVTQDNIMLRQGQTILPSGATETITQQSTTNATYRLEVKQPTGIPAVLGDSIAWEVAPSCLSSNKLSNFTTWYYTGNSTPFIDTDARNNTNVFAPNSLVASPVGYDSAHYINQGTPIEYSVHIANTTNAPVSSVGIRLQLDTMLDLTTIEPYAATHAYTWAISGNNTLSFVFDNIVLPNTNDLDATASVAFRVRTKSQLIENTIIQNNAIVQLGSTNIATNSVFHTIKSNNTFIQVLSFEHFQASKIKINIFPNPMQDRATIQFLSDAPNKVSELKIYNAVGQNVLSLSPSDNNIEISRQNLPAGIYIYQLFDAQGALLGLGKIIMQ